MAEDLNLRIIETSLAPDRCCRFATSSRRARKSFRRWKPSWKSAYPFPDPKKKSGNRLGISQKARRQTATASFVRKSSVRIVKTTPLQPQTIAGRVVTKIVKVQPGIIQRQLVWPNQLRPTRFSVFPERLRSGSTIESRPAISSLAMPAAGRNPHASSRRSLAVCCQQSPANVSNTL